MNGKIFRAVVKTEALSNLRSLRFVISAVITITLAALATLVAAERYELAAESYESRSARNAAALRELSVYSSLQPVVEKPPEPLSILDEGRGSHLGTSVPIHLYAIPWRATGEGDGNDFMGSLPHIDLTTVVKTVLGLLAILITFDALEREKRSGLCKMIFAGGTPRATVMGGKILGGLLSLAVPLAVSVGLSIAILFRNHHVELTASHWLRMAGLAGSYIAYLFFMLLLGLHIALSTRRAPVSLVVSVFAWVGLVFLLPQAVRLATNDPVEQSESRQVMEEEVASLEAELEQWRREEIQRHPLLARFNAFWPSSLDRGSNGAVRLRYGSPAYYDALGRYYRRETAVGRQYAGAIFAVRQRHEAALAAAARTADLLAAPSPAALLDHLSGSFAATTVADHDRFLSAARRYRTELVEELERRGAFASWRWFTDDDDASLQPWPSLFGQRPEDVAGGELGALFNRLSEPAVAARLAELQERFSRDPKRRLPLEGLPPFRYPPLSFGEALLRAVPELAAMLILNGLLLAAVFTRFERAELV